MAAVTSWVLYNTVQTGQQIRKSYYAVTASSGVLYRESLIYNDLNQQGAKPFQPQPVAANDADAMDCAEATCYVPGTTNAGEAPLVWTLQKQTVNGAKVEELWSAPTPTGATTAGFLYRTTTCYLGVNASGAKPFQPQPVQLTQYGIKCCSQTLMVAGA